MGLIVGASPDTGVLFTLAAALARGSRARVVAVFGCTLGIVPHLLAAVTGAAALLHASSVAFQSVKVAAQTIEVPVQHPNQHLRSTRGGVRAADAGPFVADMEQGGSGMADRRGGGCYLRQIRIAVTGKPLTRDGVTEHEADFRIASPCGRHETGHFLRALENDLGRGEASGVDDRNAGKLFHAISSRL